VPADFPAILAWWNDPEVRRAHGLPLHPLGLGAVAAWHRRPPDGAMAWAVEWEGELIGTIELAPRPDGRTELGVVIGDAARRGRGIGRRLCAFLAAWASRCYGAVELSVRADNARARRAFAAAGFVVVGSGADGVLRMRWEAPIAAPETGRAAAMQFLDRTRALTEDLVRWRRHLHAHPELAHHEEATVAYIEGELAAMGLTPRRLGGGVVADITGAAPGATVALRADMDALPLVEASGEPFAPARPGAMHACGHDAHVAGVLGAGRVLAERRQELRGCVRLLFQPAEELPPGGALAMIEAGALDGVDGIVGLHVDAGRPVGQVLLNRGAMSANSQRFRIAVRGAGGHGSRPHETVDAVVVASRLVDHLQTVVSRRLDPRWPAVVTVGTVRAGSADNIIAAEAELAGTLRSTGDAAAEALRREVRRIAEGVAALEGGRAEVEFGAGYPAVVNPEHGITDVVHDAAVAVVGEGGVVTAPTSLGGEDFAHYQRVVPGVFFKVGAGGEGWPPHHSPRFRVDEACLPLGAAILALSAWRLAADGVPAS
jgi:amidohydrolase